MNSRQICQLGALLIAVLLNVGCGETTTTEKLTITGSSTLAPMIAQVGRKFEEEHPGVRVEVQSGGSGRGIRDARSGVADIGMASRALKPDETDGVEEVIVAWDGVAFVIHTDNPVSELSRKQLAKIYSGAVDNWKAFGGPDAPIVVSNRAAGRSELDLVAKYLNLKKSEFKPDVIDGETQQSIKTVSTNKNAITYTSIGAAQYAADNGEPLKLLPLEGTAATKETVRQGGYPLARPLILIARSGSSNRLMKSFLQFSNSSVIDSFAEGLGYVPPMREQKTE